MDLQSTYNPLFYPAYQMDCFHLIAELGIFCKDMLRHIDDIENDEDIISANRIAFVTSRFLQDFVLKHPAFHAQYSYVPVRRNKKRSVWRY